MNETILFVDDDARVVSALQRSLYRAYRIEIAGSPQDALQAIAETTYAVVVSDLQMPGMNGIEFLSRVKTLAPDTVRILLTGQADLDAAIGAVNEGSIFRFLAKPCPQESLTKALDAALQHYGLVTAEKDLLRETLMGTVAVLIEILSASQPVAFGRASRIRLYVRRLARELHVAEVWQLEAAAMLSQIGCISVPTEVLKRYYKGEDLSPAEMAQVSEHPQVGFALLQMVPRLQVVAQIIARQREAYKPVDGLASEAYIVALGAQMLHVALDFDRLVARGVSVEAALSSMRANQSIYHPEVLAAWAGLPHDPTPVELQAHRLDPDMEPALDQQLFRPIADQVLQALREQVVA